MNITSSWKSVHIQKSETSIFILMKYILHRQYIYIFYITAIANKNKKHYVIVSRIVVFLSVHITRILAALSIFRLIYFLIFFFS